LSEAVCTTASRDEFCRNHGLDPARPIFALLPGSRHKEIHYHLPVMLDAALRLRSFPFGSRDSGSRIQKRLIVHEASNQKSQISNLKSQISNPQFVVPLASTVRREDVEAAIQKARRAARVGASSEGDQLCVTVVEGDTYNALGHSQFAVVASGTATVEAALTLTPMVIIYRASEINWRLIRPLIHLDSFGMVNLIAGHPIVPELIQHEATGEKIASEALAILSDPARLRRMKEDLARVSELLSAGGSSASERAAQAVFDVIART
jgi:lipid-A-disaccharide synthase